MHGCTVAIADPGAAVAAALPPTDAAPRIAMARHVTRRVIRRIRSLSAHLSHVFRQKSGGKTLRLCERDRLRRPETEQRLSPEGEPLVGDTGIEPVTSSVSRKRASPCANRPAAEGYTMANGVLAALRWPSGPQNPRRPRTPG